VSVPRTRIVILSACSIACFACGTASTTSTGANAPKNGATATHAASIGGDGATQAPEVRVLPAAAASEYPQQTVGYRECWNGLAIEDDADADYAEILAACGKPTGMLPFVAPVRGRLDAADKSDKLALPLKKGMCYRFIAVGNQSLGDLDLRIEKVDGTLIAVDKTTHPVAIIDGESPLCVDEDVEWAFVLEVEGNGQGNYVFGVLAKPK